jgi:hypothetical protein
MRRSLDPDDPTGSSSSADPDVERFVEDLRTAFPARSAPHGIADDHVAAMMAAVEVAAEAGTSRAGDAGGRPSNPRRRTMRHRITVRIAAVVTGLLLSMGGLAIAGAFPGSDDGDDQQAVVTDLDENVELPDTIEDVADDQGEDADEVADADDQGENEDAAENEDADENDDADETEDADDQGEDGDDQGEDVEENDADDQGEDEGDVEENDDQQGEDADDGIEDGGDSED